jgi:hypothetical protein
VIDVRLAYPQQFGFLDDTITIAGVGGCSTIEACRRCRLRVDQKHTREVARVVFAFAITRSQEVRLFLVLPAELQK